jgi:hypothetical protein
MNRAQIIVCFCALMLCFLWADVITPRFTDREGDHFNFDALFTPINFVAWAVIVVIAAAVYLSGVKKKNS